MVSIPKRLKYVSEMSSSEEDYSEDAECLQERQVSAKCPRRCEPVNTIANFQQEKLRKKPTRVPKIFSRNALMARENRLKKKMYITDLENQVTHLKKHNKNLANISQNQSFLISKLRKEITYLKSVLTNSKDIGNLIKSINHSTGMSVTSSSLDRQQSVNNVSVEKPRKIPIARKTPHPWDENPIAQDYSTFPSPESSNCYSSPDHNLLDEELFLNFPFDNLLDNTIPDDFTASETSTVPLEEHNYTIQPLVMPPDDVGVCLHVSKHKVSLEFCPTCSDNAKESWKCLM